MIAQLDLRAALAQGAPHAVLVELVRYGGRPCAEAAARCDWTAFADTAAVGAFRAAGGRLNIDQACRFLLQRYNNALL